MSMMSSSARKRAAPSASRARLRFDMAAMIGSRASGGIMSARAAPFLVLAAFVHAFAPAQTPGPKDTSKLEQAKEEASRSFTAANFRARALFDQCEKAVAKARAESGATWIPECGRVLEPLSNEARDAIQKKGAGARPAIVASAKKDGPVLLQKIEEPTLKLLEP